MYNLETKVFYCQIDSCRAIKEYQKKGLCVRLLAVEEQFFSAQALERKEGVEVISIEVSYWAFLERLDGAGRVPAKAERDKFDLLDDSVRERSRWYRLEVDWNTKTRHGYAYPTFSEEKPRYFELVSCRTESQTISLGPAPLFNQEVMKLPLSHDTGISTSNASPWTLSAFHVGQGMCSIVSDGKQALLLDIGAGTPVTRPLYQEGKITNELAQVIEGIKTIDLILSHADQDHWRILAWDAELRKKIRHIFVPENAKSLAYKDPAIKFDIKEIQRLHIVLSTNSWLDVYRSQPKRDDDNGQCLVTVFESAGKRALIAGDYVYSRFPSDTNKDVADLQNQDFDAVVVPHHGDAESAHRIVKARQGAIAFFSAGNHRKFLHPTQISRDNHKKEKYTEICNNNCPDVRRVTLI
ncbi:hypothetical protein I5P86_06620 [Pseudomonas glycinae]|uniref:hypothetical protein n=1 Tax=Pseudomonas glycinae TaxID=1785145 RepID=UPI0018D885F1|nr:hypothetical protein [Pseudomonas glycinae]MBH3404720.1 hypothetical protein [Pseudomonas glycinae]